MEKDYYKILGVEKGAEKADIKKAYKKLAKKYHPDINKADDATKKFKEINEAASVLGDDQKRQQYDQYGTTYDKFTGHGFNPNDFGFGGTGGGFGGVDLNDIFDSLFGGGGGFGGGFGGRRSTNRATRGSDLQYNMEITLEDAAFGIEKEIKYPREINCPKCNGSGAKSDSDVKTCSQCNGSGQEKTVKRTAFGMFQSTSTCSKCGGQGKEITKKCETCHGNGIISDETKIKVKIPAGADTGTNLRLSGKGEAGRNGGPAGDLYVVLQAKPHENFERHGDDLFVEQPIPFPTAALGGEIEVPTIDGKATLKIPSGTQSETIFRMKGKGIPHLRGYGKGDQKVLVRVEVPKKLTKKQKDLIKDFAGTLGKKKGFFKF